MKKEFCSGRCIVLRKIPYRETSFIVHTLTENYGRMDFVIKGALKNKGKNSGSRMDLPELFREYFVEYSREKSHTGGNLKNPGVFELYAIHDAVAKNISAYLECCRFSSFLLKYSREEQELQMTFRAFSNLLSRLEKEENRGKEGFFTDLAFFVYLNENGLLPEIRDEQNNAVFSSLLSFAAGELTLLPPCPEDFPARCHKYLHSILNCHNLSEK